MTDQERVFPDDPECQAEYDRRNPARVVTIGGVQYLKRGIEGLSPGTIEPGQLCLRRWPCLACGQVGALWVHSIGSPSGSHAGHTYWLGCGDALEYCPGTDAWAYRTGFRIRPPMEPA